MENQSQERRDSSFNYTCVCVKNVDCNQGNGLSLSGCFLYKARKLCSFHPHVALKH